jgi:hypothetical protein
VSSSYPPPSYLAALVSLALLGCVVARGPHWRVTARPALECEGTRCVGAGLTVRASGDVP